MRYVSLILFAVFLVFSIDFATQNTVQVSINYNLDWLNFNFITERPIFVPIFFSFASGIFFSVLYFFISHASFLRKLLIKNKQIKKLERLLEIEKTSHNKLIDQKEEIKQNIYEGPTIEDDNNLQEIDSENFKK